MDDRPLAQLEKYGNYKVAQLSKSVAAIIDDAAERLARRIENYFENADEHAEQFICVVLACLGDAGFVSESNSHAFVRYANVRLADLKAIDKARASE